ncbi:hypothetical protein [Kineosporia sp. NBRC 101731]|uniref:hypothetical protein n=1 Tax=Kineosporia sp. NBRC 101731 TaxID=3032199 RepID=UPI00249FF13A|nr:hypothetical protein [Kineosporia sp. NBRC 101731]GLY32032.1 hypothetical protein Kisp02_53970 [Kineosporia sp. NBRC 101731]
MTEKLYRAVWPNIMRQAKSEVDVRAKAAETGGTPRLEVAEWKPLDSDEPTDIVDEERVRKLQRFAELVGPVVTNTALLTLIVDEERLTEKEVSELVALTDDLGVTAK